MHFNQQQSFVNKWGAVTRRLNMRLAISEGPSFECHWRRLKTSRRALLSGVPIPKGSNIVQCHISPLQFASVDPVILSGCMVKFSYVYNRQMSSIFDVYKLQINVQMLAY